MNIARFLWNNRIQWGIVEGDEVRAIQDNLYEGAQAGTRLCALSDVRLLAPIDVQTNKVSAIA
ncbi:MAG TPA: DUF2437 domain-containing protein, partial [Dehalococcoidia bacterium]|nr:DUF2437 domain-containing protein [Dehalococcoidia bacterium]